jgi:hypothetical protein
MSHAVIIDSMNKKQYATRALVRRTFCVQHDTALHPSQAAMDAAQEPAQVAKNMLQTSTKPLVRFQMVETRLCTLV